MQAENLAVNQSRQWQVVKQVREELPHVRIAIFAQALVVEAVDLGDLAGLVVAAQNCDSLTVSHLKYKEN